MGRVLKSTATLIGLLLAVALAGLWGWQALTRPFPKSEEPPLCVDQSVAAGSKIYPDELTVSVLNASDRAGLAGRTRDLFTDRGFGAGELGNAPDTAQVTRAEIWVADTADPGALLVRSYLGKQTPIIESTSVPPGITVVVGESFSALRKGRKFVVADTATSVCTAPTSGADPNA